MNPLVQQATKELVETHHLCPRHAGEVEDQFLEQMLGSVSVEAVFALGRDTMSCPDCLASEVMES